MLGDEGVTRALTISWLSALGWVTGCGSPHGSEAVSDTERETSEPTSTTSSQSADETAATETSGTGHDGLLVEATVTRVVLDAGQDELIQLVAHDADDQPHPVPEGVVWSSSDPSVASVDDAGLVVAVATGDATVTASVAEQEVEVEVRVRGFTSAPVLLSDNLNIYADPGIAVVADGHGIIVNRDRDGVEHRVKLHVIEGSMGWQPNAVVAPAMTPVSSQAVPMSDHYLVAIRESNEAPAYFGYQPGGDLVPRPLAADTIYSQLTPSAWTDEAFVFHSDTYDGPLKALSVRVDDLTDFGTIDSGALQGAAFDSTGRGLVVTREADSDDLRILTYEPGSGFGTPTVISSADLEYATLCTKIAINEAGDGAILQIRDLSPVGARIIPIEAGKVGAPHPPFSEPEGLWCASSSSRAAVASTSGATTSTRATTT